MGHGFAGADDSAYPSRPVRIVVGFPPGQTVDVFSRAIASVVTTSLGKNFFVDNRPGAGGIIGAEVAKHAAPDGYTLLFSSSGPLAINPAIYKKLPYDPIKDFSPIAVSGIGPLFLVANLSFPPNTLGELITYVKANPGKVGYGSGGVGITAHRVMEMLKKAAGLDMLHVPYKGSTQAVNDMMGGQVQLMFEPGSTVLPLVKSGRFNVLGVSTRERVKLEPNIPTLEEQGLTGFEATTWNGFVGPAGMPAPIVDKLNAEFQRAIRSPELEKILRGAGAETANMTPAEFGAFIRAEVVKWGKAAKDAGIEPE